MRTSLDRHHVGALLVRCILGRWYVIFLFSSACSPTHFLLTPDDELAAIGLSTSISDLHAQVAGGENGAAFSIGGFGFYAKNQLEMQSKILQVRVFII